MYNCKNIDLTNTNEISIWGRIVNIKAKANICFLLLGYQTERIQCILEKKNIVNYDELLDLRVQSVIKCAGLLKELPPNNKGIKTASEKYSKIEFHVSNLEIISKCDVLPIQVSDIEDNGKTHAEVGQMHRFNNRWLDLRANRNMAKMMLKSKVTQYFSEYLLNNNFTQIFSPKIIGGSSEGGADVFKLDYFGNNACLAQSPQLYKQMAIVSDLDRVFEIGPVFRAEKSDTNRHLAEFIGLDIELVIPPNKNHHYVIDVLWNTLIYIFNNIKNNCGYIINSIAEKEGFIEPLFTKDPFVITFKKGVKLLNKNGFEQDINEDLSTDNEKALGEIIKKMYDVDLFVLDKYPVSARPFYTMLCSQNPKFTCSYDIIFRGREICSGSQRIHDAKILVERMKDKNINPESLDFYIKMFGTGCMPHGGGGFGLERIVMTYLNSQHITDFSLCPRTLYRLSP